MHRCWPSGSACEGRKLVTDEKIHSTLQVFTDSMAVTPPSPRQIVTNICLNCWERKYTTIFFHSFLKDELFFDLQSDLQECIQYYWLTKTSKSLKFCDAYQGWHCQHCVSKKFGNFAKCLTYALPQACPGTGASWVKALFPFCLESQVFFAK